MIFNVPGLGGSCEPHWQTQWERAFGFARIVQDGWERAVCDEWISRIDSVLRDVDTEEVVLTGHSLGCSAIVAWAEKYQRRIKGALLVAPSDTEMLSFPTVAVGFAPMPKYKLPFPSIVAVSSNDEFVSLERAEYFSKCWGSRFVEIGALGHVNSASNLGVWREGLDLLEELRRI